MLSAIFKWLERLSLDAVIVAVVWGIGLEEVVGRPIGLGGVIVLALATWLVYVADRLRDVGPGRDTPKTDRHLFYDLHYKPFTFVWLGGFLLSLVLAVVSLPAWKILWGWVLVLGVVWYLWILGKELGPGKRMIIKRVSVPLIFTLGVGWLAEVWRNGEAILATCVLLAGALTNVLLISYWENRNRQVPAWIPKALGGGLVALLFLGNLGLWYHLPGGLAALSIAAVYFILFLQIRIGKMHHIRAWADAGLLFGGLILALVGAR